MRFTGAVTSTVVILGAGSLRAQTPPRYPVPPVPLGDSIEVSLALSAAPEEISAHAEIYVLKGTEFVKKRSGTNGCACMVSRDLHEGSRYPVCFDQEGSRTTLLREMMETSLRAKGLTEADVQKEVAAAYAAGKLRMPSRPSIAYMMSPNQVLFSSATSDGVRIGAWSPHIMVHMPTSVTAEQFGLMPHSKVDLLQVNALGDGRSELIVKVPSWSNGAPALSARPLQP